MSAIKRHGSGNLSVPDTLTRVWAQFPLIARGGKIMEENGENKIKALLNDVDKEFLGLNHYQRAKFAIEQISTWQQKFNEAKVRIQKENSVEINSSFSTLGQYPEIEA